jgi:hypothetical protein
MKTAKEWYRHNIDETSFISIDVQKLMDGYASYALKNQPKKLSKKKQKKAAEKKYEKIVKELNEDKTIDWNNENQPKYCLWFNYVHSEWDERVSYSARHIGQKYYLTPSFTTILEKMGSQMDDLLL